jgi:hypothetical protein
VPVSVCLKEEALGILSPRSRAAAAKFVCLREMGCANSSTACRLSCPARLWYGSGEQPPLLGATPQPHQAVANLDASTPLMF